jgi:hypothetical protein
MSETPKWYGFVYRHLSGRPSRYFVLGIVLAAVGIGGGVMKVRDVVRAAGRWPNAGDEYFPVFVGFIVCGLGAGGLVLMAHAIRDAITLLDRHPDVTALRRYGPPRQIVGAVDAEMADWRNVTQIRPHLRSFRLQANSPGISYYSEVYLTPTWVVCILNAARDRLGIFRLEDIVLASRVAAPQTFLLFRPIIPRTWVTLIDRYGISIKLPFLEEDAGRLLAEVLARVPWAVNRFEPAAHHDTDADYGHFVAEADRRREEIRLTDRTPPTSPS